MELKREKINTAPAIEFRNKKWKENKYIPKWVNINEVGLDHFCTRPDVAKKCWDKFIKYLKKEKVDLSKYTFIEPSAGLGAFFNLLPKNRRIGIDVVNGNPDLIHQDFLSWEPKDKNKKYISIGNPPFGYRAWLALSFVNHAGLFSDYIGFIVPMAFQSNGKSNVKDRIKNFHLVHQSSLPADSFIDVNGKNVKINAIFQIWKKGKGKKRIEKTCNDYIDLFTADMRKERRCGHKRMHEADFFLQRTFYTEPPKLVKDFKEVKYVCGYGIILKKDKKKVLNILNNTDWKTYSNLASHNCKHISMEHIRKTLINAGFVDKIKKDETKPPKSTNRNSKKETHS